MSEITSMSIQSTCLKSNQLKKKLVDRVRGSDYLVNDPCGLRLTCQVAQVRDHNTS